MQCRSSSHMPCATRSWSHACRVRSAGERPPTAGSGGAMRARVAARAGSRRQAKRGRLACAAWHAHTTLQPVTGRAPHVPAPSHRRAPVTHHPPSGAQLLGPWDAQCRCSGRPRHSIVARWRPPPRLAHRPAMPQLACPCWISSPAARRPLRPPFAIGARRATTLRSPLGACPPYSPPLLASRSVAARPALTPLLPLSHATAARPPTRCRQSPARQAPSAA